MLRRVARDREENVTVCVCVEFCARLGKSRNDSGRHGALAIFEADPKSTQVEVIFFRDCKTIPAPPGCLFTVTGTVGWLYAAHGEIWEGGQDGVTRASSSGITHGGLNWFTSC